MHTNRIRGHRFFAACLFWLVFFLSASSGFAAETADDTLEAPSTASTRLDLSPLFFFLSAPAGGSSEHEAIGPIFHSYSTPEATGWAIRPLLAYTKTPERRHLEFFYPLGAWEKTAEVTRWQLIPFFSGRREFDQKKEGSYHRSFWPIFWGRTEDGAGYGGLFPLYGRFFERYGRDRITFALWPLYSASEWDGHRHRSLLWPIFAKTRGPKENGWRLWPLWGHTRRAGQWERCFLLWPIFLDEKKNLSTENPLHRWMVWPLYIREQGLHGSRHMFLWPFFHIYRNPVQGIVQWDLPWPFLGYASGPNYRSWRIWPLIGKRQTETSSSRFVLWPAYSGETLSADDNRGRKEVHNWLLFTKIMHQWDHSGGTTEVLTRIWPFYSYHREPSGVRFGFAPAILPFETKGFHRMYGPFLCLYEFQTESDGAGRSKALWGLYRHDWTDSRHHVSLSVLFSIGWSKRERDWALLGGLLGMKQHEGMRDYVVFFRPIAAWARDLRKIL